MTDPRRDGETLRIDKWLWFARLARTRSGAARLCEAGLVVIGGATILKPHHLVRPGDTVSVANGRHRRHLVVQALGERRGPASEARLLYDEPTPPEPLIDHERAAWATLFDEESMA